MTCAFRLRPAVAGLLAMLALVGCAPPEAAAPVSEHVRAAPPPHLLPTSAFEAPRAEGLASAQSVEAERDALAARAAALRARGAALSGTPVLEEGERARLEPVAEDAGTP
ncbi:hypothetical protein [Amaricoccus sp.]|uniref:hypothetical protein n=1 Tax=Amaricoccus sp. TaxID=1872485 RepID=UPI001B7B40EB|nr:hypothetical protein [Amaricoccus sp.]MBP7002490.1 hypothetical protein [Amaricoccus sp.]